MSIVNLRTDAESLKLEFSKPSRKLIETLNYVHVHVHKL